MFRINRYRIFPHPLFYNIAKRDVWQTNPSRKVLIVPLISNYPEAVNTDHQILSQPLNIRVQGTLVPLFPGGRQGRFPAYLGGILTM